MNNPSKNNAATVFLFATTLFVSASLMFVLQPMFGKILLPLLGGSPAVWNTCMVFYQSLLFLGYLYAHLLSTRLSASKQILVHAGLLLISLMALPLGLPDNINPPTESDPTFWLISTLFLAIGLPFFVVSTTSTLIQKWFSNIGLSSSKDPYFLYAASNIGSLIALLSYPFFIEPGIGLENQKIYWGGGYILLCVLILSCAVLFWKVSKKHQDSTANTVASEEDVPELTLQKKLYWLILALVPSSLLLGLTNFISTDIASVPLLWVIPLTLYLLSFVIVFSKWGAKVHGLMVIIQPFVLLPFIAYSLINPAILPYWVNLALHLAAFFLAIMVCHGELARNRPHTRFLTDFYLIMSFAGMLGGMFNTFVAPFIFDSVYEYPIMIIAALMLRPRLRRSERPWLQQLGMDALFPLIIFIVGLSIYFTTDNLGQYIDSIGAALILLAGLNYSFRERPTTLALSTAVLIFFTMGLHGVLSSTLFQKRTFFGVMSVRDSTLLNEKGQPEKYREFYHGTTKHGAQRLPRHLQQTPLTYFSRQGPIGQLFSEYNDQNNRWNIAVVGLGAGTLSCYAKKEQDWIFYELDPGIVDVAENPKYFTYLKNCAHKITMKVGDARLSIVKEPDQRLDLLIIDAFSSDAIPTHLLTQEAFDLYFSKIKPNGILAFHITNRHLALKKVLSDHSQTMKIPALIQEFKPKNPPPLVVATDWVVMAKNKQVLEPLRQSNLGHWQKMPLYFGLKSWTDDFTNIIDIWKD
ncbi:MAG TPA: spermidine synthase [Methylococcaceae bacterium]|nr:spermidine synthase [Methylococcaceae bacterium]HIN68393.1 spermidine synthase [Methylococcales bacterium]HIA44530.1 spermidine synthase [Methylococcaceae bacterium]HIB63415.1 spermidine synthase [Methylococcaceae bacterium]HIO12648.1 spermidine synthase [Methylococcales bacterium]